MTQEVTTPEPVQEATQAVAQATTQALAQTQAAEQQAQTLLDHAKSLVSDQKYQEALNTVGQLTGFKLTADQQKTLDDLKSQIQSALSNATVKDAASALGNALGGKK